MKEQFSLFWERRDKLSPQDKDALQNLFPDFFSMLESGEIRVMSDDAVVHEWVKEAILLFFKITPMNVINNGFTNFYDKVPLQFANHTADDFSRMKVRVVPDAIVRRGAHIGANTVLMPCYVNIGAYIGAGSMIDTWATVGSCAQIGRNVHISGGVGIGGVLEPLQAEPCVIEDNCFIGARSEIVEGVRVGHDSVISMGVFIGQSTKIYDRETDTITYGAIPPGSVVVPGSLPDGKSRAHLNCAVIVKRVDDITRAKVALNEYLREELA